MAKRPLCYVGHVDRVRAAKRGRDKPGVWTGWLCTYLSIYLHAIDIGKEQKGPVLRGSMIILLGFCFIFYFLFFIYFILLVLSGRVGSVFSFSFCSLSL